MAATKVDHGAQEAARHKIDGKSIERSPEWPKVQKAHLAKRPNCACCAPGKHNGAGVQVHHIFPFHYCIALGRPDLELDDRNLITLCETETGKPAEDHHLVVGHLGDFQSSNLAVKPDAQVTFHDMTREQIVAAKAWQEKKAKRLAPLDKMTVAEKEEFKTMMNKHFPQR